MGVIIKSQSSKLFYELQFDAWFEGFAFAVFEREEQSFCYDLWSISLIYVDLCVGEER